LLRRNVAIEDLSLKLLNIILIVRGG